VKQNDVIGVAVQQSDLPMLQFLLNGEPLNDLAVNRFRGMVYPAVYLPAALSEDETSAGICLQLVFDESQFEQMPPHARFGPVIVARGII